MAHRILAVRAKIRVLTLTVQRTGWQNRVAMD